MSEERTFVCEAVVGDVSHMECDLVIDASYFRSARSTRLSDGTRVVEERTCHAVEGLEPDGIGAPPRHTTHCSRCGQLWDETDGVPRCPAYCPTCGARVVDGDE